MLAVIWKWIVGDFRKGKWEVIVETRVQDDYGSNIGMHYVLQNDTTGEIKHKLCIRRTFF